jgi:hypothetical protein
MSEDETPSACAVTPASHDSRDPSLPKLLLTYSTEFREVGVAANIPLSSIKVDD